MNNQQVRCGVERNNGFALHLGTEDGDDGRNSTGVSLHSPLAVDIRRHRHRQQPTSSTKLSSKQTGPSAALGAQQTGRWQ